MRQRSPARCVLTALVVLASLSAARISGQAPTAFKGAPAAKPWTPPKTSWGDPDLQGLWTNYPDTPLERPRELGDRAFFTDQEYKKRVAEYDRRSRDEKSERSDGGVGAGPENWYEFGTPTRRTSLILDPPDGRIPPMTFEGQRRLAASMEARRQRAVDYPWEGRTMWERCITRALPMSMIPGPYNNNYQILQMPGYVAIQYELIHDLRIIPLDGRPHIPENIRQIFGDSRGRWDGNTLVVDVTNFSDVTHGSLIPAGWPAFTNFRGGGSTMHLVERFTRVDAGTIDYQFTIDDPTTFTRPWTASLPLKKDHITMIYEYACHEGNYGMANLLSAMRAEADAAERKAK